jgi:hypothetical protein
MDITLDNFKEHFFSRTPMNIGIQLGSVSAGLCDVDLDCEEARKLAPHFLPPTNAIFGRPSSERSHWLYKSNLWKTASAAVTGYDDPTEAAGEHGVRLIELRTGRVTTDAEGNEVVKGAVSMAPPSLHPSGERVRWDEDGEAAEVEAEKLRADVAELAAATLLVKHYPREGKRHEGALVLGGVLARVRMQAEDIKAFMAAVAEAAGDEQVEDRAGSAASAFDRLRSGEECPGLPRLRQVWGEQVADVVAEWLGLEATSVSQEEEAGTQRMKQTELILEQAAEAGLFHSDDDNCYADIERNGHRETLRIGSTAFRQWLLHEYYRKSGGMVPSAEPLRAAIETLKARALYDGPQRSVYLRVASADGKIYLDLADDGWRAVEVDENGWRLIINPPVRFRRAPGMRPLPVPVKSDVTKALRTLRRLVNLRKDDDEPSIDDTDFVLLVCFMAAALRSDEPSLPYPVLGIQGEEGSAKSTLAGIAQDCIDPHRIKERRLPREDRDLFIGANKRHVVAFGNVSQLPEWLSNSLCNLSTGGGFATRALYTDEDEILFSATRVIILNGIKFAVRPDLADRMVLLRLPPLPPGSRKSDKRLLPKFERARPAILGALLDIVSYGLRELPATPEEDTLRMADFVQWGTACEGAAWEPGTFRRAYAANRRKATLEVIESDVVADAIRSLVTAKEPEWKGTMQGLLDDLSEQVGERQSKSKEWPSGARELRSRLDHARATLRRVGINIRLGAKTRRGRMITLRFEEPAVPSTLGKDRHHRHHQNLSLKSNNLDGAGPGDEGGDRRDFERSGGSGRDSRDGAGRKTRRNADRHQDQHHVSGWKTTTSDDGDDGDGLSPTYSEKDIEFIGPPREDYKWKMSLEEKEIRKARMRRHKAERERQRKKRDDS